MYSVIVVLDCGCCICSWVDLFDDVAAVKEIVIYSQVYMPGKVVSCQGQHKTIAVALQIRAGVHVSYLDAGDYYLGRINPSILPLPVRAAFSDSLSDVATNKKVSW